MHFRKFRELFPKILRTVISKMSKIISVSLGRKKYGTLGKIFRKVSKNISEILKKFENYQKKFLKIWRIIVENFYNRFIKPLYSRVKRRILSVRRNRYHKTPLAISSLISPTNGKHYALNVDNSSHEWTKFFFSVNIFSHK